MTRCVMFDLGNVLVHFDTQTFYDFIAAHQHSDEVKPEDFFRLRCVVSYDLGLLDDREYFEAVQEAYKLDVNLVRFFWEFTNVIRPDQKMIKLKQVLRQNSVKVVIVSNTNPRNVEYITQRWPEVFADFDYLALSFRVRARKPDWIMFQTPASELGVKPDECLLIDDHEPNILSFRKWSKAGVGYHYDVVDNTFCQNGRLDGERRKLVFHLASLGLITFSQAEEII